MFDSLFGMELPLIAKFVLAFAVVLGAMAGLFWLMKRLGANRVGADKTRGRQPRLAVIDAAAVDSRRRLVLIRRDNVEHLVLIGGPSDVVIEQNIVRAVPVAPAREAPPPRGPGETVTRGTDMVRQDSLPRPAAEPNWPPPPPPEAIRPRPEPPLRSSEPARPLPESLSPMRGPPMSEPREPRPPMQRPPAEMPPVEVRQSPPTADVNLADMAQRLEAALRRPGPAPEPRSESRAEPRREPPRDREPPARPAPLQRPAPPAADAPPPPVSRAIPPRPAPPAEPMPAPMARPAPPAEPMPAPIARPAAPPSGAPPSAAPPPPPEPPPEPSEPAAEPPRSETPAPPKPEPAAARPAQSKSVFDSLEEEMASLLGRPPDKP
jgi:hypothetical protein